MAHLANWTLPPGTATGDHTNFIKCHTSLPAEVFTAATASGGDIRFFMSDGVTEVPREIVSFDKVGQTCEIWMNTGGLITASAGAEYQIHADGVSSDYAVTDAFGRNAVWDDYAVVMHMEDLTDSSGNYTPSNNGATAVAGGYSFDGANDVITIGNVTANMMDSSLVTVDWTPDITDPSEQSPLISSYDTSAGRVFEIHQFATSQYEADHRVFWGNSSGSAYGGDIKDNGPIIAGTRYRSAVTKSGATVALYRDGANSEDSRSGTIPSSQTGLGLLTLGSRPSQSTRWFDGTIHSARIRTSSVSAQWVADEYADQSGNADWNTYSAVGGGTSIAANDLAQAQSLDNIVLSQNYILAPNGLTHSQTIDVATVGTVADVSPNAIDSTQSIDQPALTQAHIIAPAELLHGHTIDSPSLSQANTLAPAEIAHSQTIAIPGLTQAHVLTVQEIAQGQSIVQAALTVAGAISVAGVSQAQILGTLELVQAHLLNPNGLAQLQALGATVLSANALNISPAGLSQANAIDAASLTQFNVLAVDDLTQQQIIDAALFGGLIVGELNGQVVIYAAMGGNVYAIPALSGTVN